MAQWMVKSAKLNPGNALTQALSDYEAILTDQQRVLLHSHGKPGVMDALNLATSIDSVNSGRRRQCIGSRFITLLQSVQQFTTIVDTFVSSNPNVAALIWGGVKTTLLVANNIASYSDNLSILFMKIGLTCPRFVDFEYLYPTSTRLQKALCDYYAAVVRLCKHSTQSCEKQNWTRFPKALLNTFESEFGPYEKELDRLAQHIQEETFLASIQAQKLEAQLQARERTQARHARRAYLQDREVDQKRRLEIDRRKSHQDRQKILNSLSTYDHQKAYKQTRRECVIGTSTWICQTPEFKSWMIEPLKSIWCTGRLGSGKTVLTSCVIAYIAETVSPKDVTSYFFCRYDDAESLRARTIFGSIARQLTSDLPTEAFLKFPDKTADMTAIYQFLETVLIQSRRYFIILDGLDECEETQLKEVTDFLRRLLDLPLLQIKFYFTSRSNVMTWLPLKLRPERQIRLDTVENQASVALDIDTFIYDTLAGQLLETERLVGDPNLIPKIQDTLKKGAQGMFLWVYFQLQTICAQKSDAGIIAALEDLPRDLPQTFERILSKITETGDVDIGRHIFLWVAAAKRPLVLEELREAIGTQPLQESWDSTRFVNDMKQAIACCGNLVFVDEEQQSVHFIHHSVKQYLVSKIIRTSLQHYHIDPEDADIVAGSVCITYLNFSIFQRQIARRTALDERAAGIPAMVIKRSLRTGGGVNKVALGLLQRPKKASNAITRSLEKALGNAEAFRQQQTQEQFPFLSYAKRFWLEHTKSGIEPNSKKLWKLWCNLINDANMGDAWLSVPCTYEDWTSRANVVVKWTVEQNHCALGRLLMDSNVDLDPKNLQYLVEGAAIKESEQLLSLILSSRKDVPKYILGVALKQVAAMGNIGRVEKLLSAQADVNVPAGSNDSGVTALQAAAAGGHIEVVEKLLSAGAEVNAPAGTGNYCRTALQAATEQGHIEIVRRLLSAHADVNAPAGWYGTALQAAAGGGYIEVVKELLSAHADVNVPAGDRHGGRTALQAAAEGGYIEVVETLLSAGAEVNAPAGTGNYGRTALQAAAEKGHIDVVEKLLSAHAEVNAPAGWKGTALQAAAEEGHFEIVEKLLSAHADVNETAGPIYGRTALQVAAEAGKIEMVDKLLSAGADVNAPAGAEDYGRTALQAAAEAGHIKIVEKLLSAGADVNAPAGTGNHGRTALQAAAEGGHIEVVEKLLSAGAEVNAPASGKYGRTALQGAAVSGHIEVAEKLLSAHADANAPAGPEQVNSIKRSREIWSFQDRAAVTGPRGKGLKNPRFDT